VSAVVTCQEALEIAQQWSKDHANEALVKAKEAERVKEEMARAEEAKRARKERSGAKEAMNKGGAERQQGCIAMTTTNNLCGSRSGLTMTKLGPLCARHAKLCKSESSSGSDSGISKSTASNYSSSPEKSETEARSSPEDSIWLPESKAALTKEKKRKGALKYSVIAVRTFPNSERPKTAAGSVWLSWEEADLSNTKGGQMKSFKEVKDIFGNIARAKAWIEDQVTMTDDSGEGSSEEAERRMQAAMNAVDKSHSKGQKKKKGVTKKKKASKSKRKQSRGSKKKSTADESRNSANTAGGGGDPEESDEPSDDDPSDDEHSRGMFGSEFRRRRRQKGVRKGGLRSGATRLLDKMQSRIQKQLFQPDADPVVVLTEDSWFFQTATRYHFQAEPKH
jgi:hypothetical protein